MKYYVSVEARLLIEATSDIQAKAIALAGIAAIEADESRVEVQGSDVIACTREN